MIKEEDLQKGEEDRPIKSPRPMRYISHNQSAMQLSNPRAVADGLDLQQERVKKSARVCTADHDIRICLLPIIKSTYLKQTNGTVDRPSVSACRLSASSCARMANPKENRAS